LNIHQLEQDFEIASNDYDYINTSLKQDLPRFMQLSTQFIDPLFDSFFYMQLVTVQFTRIYCGFHWFIG
jgi:amphiphysin